MSPPTGLGATAKAVPAWNPKTNEFRSGQVNVGKGFEHWLMKFDGVLNNRDKELSDSKGYGKIEFAYHLTAVAAGIQMAPCRLHHEGGRSHFMTKRFDRTERGGKRHMLSLCAMAHYDYNQPSSYSYEQAVSIIRRLGLPREDLEQLVLRAIFNVVGRNQDDHVKNIAFLMNRRGLWRLAPAFDISYAWDPKGDWTSRHQMSINNKRDDFEREDLIAMAKTAGIKKAYANEMISRVIDAFRGWPKIAESAGVSTPRIDEIRAHQRTHL
jgi:serine/threonine-protein kinase HipA